MTQITRKSVPARGLVLLLAMFLGAGLVLSGCGDDSTPVTPAPAPAPPPPAPEPDPEPPAPEAPATPTGLAVSGMTETSVTYTWNAVEGAFGYEVQVSMDETFTADDTIVPTLVTTYTVSPIAAGTSVYVRVRAGSAPTDPEDLNSSVRGEWTTHVSGMATAPDAPMPPMAPTGLMVSETGGDFIEWSWTAVEGADGYMVQFSTTDEGFTDAEAMVVADGATSYRAEELDPGTTAYLRVRAFTGEGDSRLMSNWSMHRTGTSNEPPPPMPPSAPTGLMVSDKGVDFIEWTWEAVDGADGYLVQFSADADFTDATDVLVADGTSYRAGDLAPGTTGHLRVQAFMGENGSWLLSDWTMSVTGASDPLPAPDAPTMLQVSDVGEDFIEWTWEAVDGADGYLVQFSMDEGFADAEEMMVTEGTSYRAGDLAPETTVYLRVRAFRGEGDSRQMGDWSIHRTGTSARPVPPTPPAAPTGLTVEVGDPDDGGTGHQVRWAWEAVEGADGYVLQFSSDEIFTSEDVTTEISETEYSDVVVYGRTRYVRVRAFTGEGDSRLMSDWTTHVTATAPAAPVVPTPVVVTFSVMDDARSPYPMVPDDGTNKKTAMASVNPALMVDSNADALITPMFVEGATAVRVRPIDDNMPFALVDWKALQSMVVDVGGGATFEIRRVTVGANQEMMPTGDTAYVTCGPFECMAGMDAPAISIANSAACEGWDPTLDLEIGIVDNNSGAGDTATTVANGGSAHDLNGLTAATGQLPVRDGYDMGWVYSSSQDMRVTHNFGTYQVVVANVEKGTNRSMGAALIPGQPHVVRIDAKDDPETTANADILGSNEETRACEPMDSYGGTKNDIDRPRTCFRLGTGHDYFGNYEVTLEPRGAGVSWGRISSWDALKDLTCDSVSYTAADMMDVCDLFEEEVEQAHASSSVRTVAYVSATSTELRLVGFDLQLGNGQDGAEGTNVTPERYTALWYHEGRPGRSSRNDGHFRNLYDFNGATTNDDADRHAVGIITKRVPAATGSFPAGATSGTGTADNIQREVSTVWVPVLSAYGAPLYGDLGKVDSAFTPGADIVEIYGGDDDPDNFTAPNEGCSADDGGTARTSVDGVRQYNGTLCDANDVELDPVHVFFTDKNGGPKSSFACEVQMTYTITCDWDASGGTSARRNQTLGQAGGPSDDTHIDSFLSCTVSR